ncbi:acyltransferase [Sporanaerobacter acetigenes]|uniref:Membrane-bound acyltransferase YfiQ, involved in biofilm formation n=1 Tax=Sporanaerobacter acetigenes DSM 13106 TaxID=1123281 RepID=A0A1M5T892_9FIRM|nr:acyltransferase [Sporanaerobacter acetigenes]SHH46918.1 Membrane-bound acyltransferase YfiQ, involved in biofilm formation [Sporanaerobacter acetigenes DSM 13106]
MARRKEIEELYYIRGLAALGILIIHATGSFAVLSEYGSRAMYVGVFLNQFFRFGSPVFMMISGLVLFYNYRSFDEFDTKRFYKKKLKYIFLPYTIWSAIYFLYAHYVNNIPLKGEMPKFLRGILLGENYSHLYFIFLIFQFYILVPLILKYLIEPMKEKPIQVFFIFALIQGAILIYEYYFRNPNAEGFMKLFNRYYWKTVFGWSSYFMTGGLIGLHYENFVDYIEKHIKGISIIYILVSTFYLGQVYFNIYINEGRNFYGKFGSIRPHTMIYAFFTMAMLIYITRKIAKKGNFFQRYLKNFGTYSFGVYFSHPLVLEELKLKLVGNFSSVIGYSRLSSLVLIVGLGIIFTYLLVLLLGSLNIRWLFIGKIPKYQLSSTKSH